jgi:competence protein ComEA
MATVRSALLTAAIVLVSLPAFAADSVNINSAGAERLTQLHGVGSVLASRIVEYRDANGEFDSVSDLTAVKGIGDKTAADLKEQATVE